MDYYGGEIVPDWEGEGIGPLLGRRCLGGFGFCICFCSCFFFLAEMAGCVRGHVDLEREVDFGVELFGLS